MWICFGDFYSNIILQGLGLSRAQGAKSAQGPSGLRLELFHSNGTNLCGEGNSDGHVLLHWLHLSLVIALRRQGRARPEQIAAGAGVTLKLDDPIVAKGGLAAHPAVVFCYVLGEQHCFVYVQLNQESVIA